MLKLMKRKLSCQQLVPNWPINLRSHACLAVLILSMLLSTLAVNSTETRPTVPVNQNLKTTLGPNSLKGNTEIVEYDLNDIHSYREAMAQLQQRNFRVRSSCSNKRLRSLAKGMRSTEPSAFTFKLVV